MENVPGSSSEGVAALVQVTGDKNNTASDESDYEYEYDENETEVRGSILTACFLSGSYMANMWPLPLV
jgi:hypothetical protein